MEMDYSTRVNLHNPVPDTNLDCSKPLMRETSVGKTSAFGITSNTDPMIGHPAAVSPAVGPEVGPDSVTLTR